MTKHILELLLVSLVIFANLDMGRADCVLASESKARTFIVLKGDATSPEQTAMQELAADLAKLGGDGRERFALMRRLATGASMRSQSRFSKNCR